MLQMTVAIRIPVVASAVDYSVDDVLAELDEADPGPL